MSDALLGTRLVSFAAPDPGRSVVRSSVFVELKASPGERVPAEFRIFAAGENPSTQGTFLFDAKAAKAVMAAAELRGVDLLIDYGHGSTDPMGMLNPEMSGKAAGWCSLEVRDGELWAVNVRWTPSALAAIEAKEWRYISPTFAHDKDNRPTMMLAVALENVPALHNLDPLIAASAKEPTMDANWVPMCFGSRCCITSVCCQACPCKVVCASLCYGCSVPPEPSGPVSATAMQMSAREAMASFLKEHSMKTVLAALKLSDTATEAEALAALTASLSQVTTLRADKEKLAAELVALSAKMTALEAAGAQAEVEALVEAAVKEGKISPAAAPTYKTLSAAQLKPIIEKSPKIVGTKPTGEKQGEIEVSALSADERKHCKSFGIAEADYLKHKAALVESGELGA